MNILTVSGNAGKDPEMKYFDSGSVVANFPLAVSIYNREKKENETVWFKCSVWGKKAEFTGEYIKKGSKVIVSGSLCFEKFADKEGKERIVNCVNVSEVECWDKKSDSPKAQLQTQQPKLTAETDEQIVQFGDEEIPF